MQYTRNFDFTTGTTIIADQIDMEFNTIRSILNGNINSDNLVNGSITIEKMSTDANPETRFSETHQDAVVSGLTLTPTSGWTNLLATITAGISYIGGKRVSTASVINHAFTPSKDTYIDLDKNGTFYYIETTLGGVTPNLTQNSIRVACVKTDATKITAVLTGRIINGAFSGTGTIVARPIRPELYGQTPFHAFLNVAQNRNTGETVIWDTELCDFGNNYNPTTGKYTTPYNGFYQFNTSCRSGGGGNFYFFNMIIDATNGIIFTQSSPASSDNQRTTSSVAVYLKAGTDIAVNIYEDRAGTVPFGASRDNNFNGFMIGQ